MQAASSPSSQAVWQTQHHHSTPKHTHAHTHTHIAEHKHINTRTMQAASSPSSQAVWQTQHHHKHPNTRMHTHIMQSTNKSTHTHHAGSIFSFLTGRVANTAPPQHTQTHACTHTHNAEHKQINTHAPCRQHLLLPHSL